MGDAVLRVQRHLQELARDNFARLEKAHDSNVDWLRRELEALCRTINVTVTLDLKRPLPATFSSEYVFATKKPRLEPLATTSATTPAAPVSPPTKNTVASVSAPTSVVLMHAPIDATAPAPVVECESEQPAQPPVAATYAPATSTAPAPAKRMVTRTRRVMRPRPAVKQPSPPKRRLEPERMKVVELRAELKRRGLKATGLKAALVERLLDSLDDDSESDDDDDDDVVELEAVDEEYDVEVEVDDHDDAIQTAATTSHKSDTDAASLTTATATTAEAAADPKTVGHDLLPQSLSPRKSRDDEIVRESLDDLSLSQKSVAIEPTQRLKSSDDDCNDSDVQMADAAAADVFIAAVPEDATNWTARRADAETHDWSAVATAANATASPVVTLEEPAHDRDASAIAAAEKKAALAVHFSAVATSSTSTEPPVATAKAPANSLPANESTNHLRAASLPPSNAPPVTPSGATITANELPAAHSEPMPAPALSSHLLEDAQQQQQRDHARAIEREAQRLRLAAKMSAKKRFEEAKLSSSFWSKRDRSKSQMAASTAVAPTNEQPMAPSVEQPVKAATVAPIVSIKSEPVAPTHEVANDDSRLALSESRAVAAAALDRSLHASVSVSATARTQQPATTRTDTSVKQELPRNKPTVAIPFATSSRQVSDSSRRISDPKRRDSGRRNSLTRRRDSGASSNSSDAPTTANDSTRQRKPSNLVSGLHSLTSLLGEKENATTATTRSAPVVTALKLAERSRVLEQRKQIEKAKRKEALMKRYEEQRRLDDDRKKRAVAAAALSAKDKAERDDVKLRREQEKKQRELELAKRRQQKLVEMRANLEKKRAQLAAEKQQAKLAAARRGSNDAVQTAAAKAAAVSPTATATELAKTATSVVAAAVSTKTTTGSTHQSQQVKAVVTAQSAPAPTAMPLKPVKAAPVVAAPAPAAAPVVTATAKPKHRPTDASTYDMSDNAESSDGDESDDDDDTSSSRRNKKNIPRWARKENLERVLRVQFGPNASDPSPRIFPDFVDTCDLDAIFEPTDVRKQRRFAKRSSSGNWFGDRPTAREKALYKRDMGYLR